MSCVYVRNESGDIWDILYSYNLINPPHSQKSSESQANWNKQAWRKCSSTSLLHCSPLSIYKTERLACHWLAPNHETHLWVVTKKTSQGLWFYPPCSFQFYMKQWWEMILPQLSLKGSTKQSSIKKSIMSCRARARHIPLCHSSAKADSLCSSTLGVEKVNLNYYIVTGTAISIKLVTSA